MNPENRSLRVGAVVIFCAVLMKLYMVGTFDPFFHLLASPRGTSFMLYLQTGRVIKPPEEAEEVHASLPEPTEPAAASPVFTQADGEAVEIVDEIDACPDRGALIQTPLDWDLYGEEPKVLIVHTHGTESYLKQEDEDYEESAVCRTLDKEYNVIRVGEHLAERLSQAGISVIQDRDLHDYPSYNGSYEDCRVAVEAYLAEYPSIQLVLDIHRDAADDGYGGQHASYAEVDGQQSAQLMLVLGSDRNGLEHPNWQENLSVGLKLQSQMEQQNPGICRKLDLCPQRFNQHLRPGMLLVEVGYAGNTLEEALRAVEVLGDAIINLGQGANLPGEG